MAINLTSRLSAITSDFAGVNHIVWLEDNALWHAQYNANAGTWINAQRLVEGLTESVTALNLVANQQLIVNGSTASPGLAVIWQAGDQKANSSNFYYSAAQYDSNGQLQWDAAPTTLTVNETVDGLPFANLAPRVIADNNGNITLVGQQVNVKNSANQTIREDTDLYTSALTIQSVTPAPTALPNAVYDPPVLANGVNQAAGIPVNQTTSTAPASAATITDSDNASAQSTLFSTSSTSGQAFQGLGFKYGPSLSFSTGLYKALGLDKYISGIPGGLLRLVMEPYDLVGMMTGSGLAGSELSVISQGVVEKFTGELDEKDDPSRFFEKTKKGVSISFAFSSKTSYEGKVPYNLSSIEDILAVSLLDKIPIFDKPAGLWAGRLDFIGSVGLAAVLELTSSGNTPDTLLQLVLDDAALNLPSILLGFISSAQLSEGKNGIAGALIAATVFGPIEDILIGNLTDSASLNISKYLVGPTMGANVEGLLLLAEAIKFTAAAGVDLFFGFGQGGNETTVLRIPLEVGVGLGPIGLSLSIEPTWVWPSNPPLTTTGTTTSNADDLSALASLSSTLSTSSDAPSATVAGSLLTLAFNAPLDVSSVPAATDFQLQTKTSNQSNPVAFGGSIGTISVSNDPTTGNGVVVLQLSQPIVYSPQFTGTNPQSNGQANIYLTYTGTALEFSDDTLVATFEDISVTNNSPQSLAAVFNPTTGNGQNYSQIYASLDFTAPLNTADLPPASAFTVTNSLGKTLTVQGISGSGGNPNELTLFLVASEANTNDSLTVIYTKPTSGTVLTYANGTNVAPFTASQNASNASQGAPTVGIGSQQALLGSLEADYAQDSPPALALISSTSNTEGQVLAVWSREIQPLTPIAGFVSDDEVYLAGFVNGDEVYLNFVQALNTSTTPSNSQFTVSINEDDGIAAVTNIEIEAGGFIKLNLSQAVAASDSVAISYSPSTTSLKENLYLTDAVQSQLWIPAFSGTLTNTTGQPSTATPQLLGGSVIIDNGGADNLVTLIFNGLLGGNTPNGNQFTVVNNGQAYAVDIEDVAVSGNTVTFNVPAPNGSPLISQGDIVTVAYIPGSEGNQNLNGLNGTVIAAFTSTALVSLPINPSTTLMAGLYSPGSTASGLSQLQNIPGTDGLNFDPAVAADTNGNALAVWVYADSSNLVNLVTPGEFYTDNQTQVIIDALNQSDIYFSYWNGSNWTIAAPLATDQPGTDRNITVAYDSSNDQYIAAWLNSDDTFQVFNPEVESSAAPAFIINNGTFYLAYVEQGGSQISLTTSSNAGETWASAVQLPSTITTAQSPALAFYQGLIYLAYVGTNNELNITSSSDNGTTWSTHYIVSGLFSNNGVSLVVYQGQLMAFTVSDSNSNITYYFSGDPQLSTSWSQPYTFPTPEGYPTTAGSGVSATVMGNTLFLAYRGGTVDSPASYYSASTNGSTLGSLDWSTSELIGATFPNTAPGITNDGSQLYFTYGDSNGDLQYLTSFNGNSWSGLNEITNQASNDMPSPATLNGALYLGYTSTDAEENIYVTGVTNETTIYWASYTPADSTTPAAWSEVNTVLSEATPDPLTDLVISAVNGQPALFWTQTQPISYSQLTTQNNPELYFRLGELAGTTAQNQGTLGAMANGTYNGTFTLKEAGALFDSSNNSGDPNPAVLFSDGGRMTIGGALSASGSAFSIEFWFKIPTAVSETTNLVNLGGVFSVVLNSDSTLTFSLTNSSSITTSASANPISTDAWYYVVGTYSNQTEELNLYLNSYSVATVNNVAFTPSANATFTIAGGDDQIYLDEVALYSNALSYSAPTSTQPFNSLDLLNTIFNTDQIGEKYAAQYVAPLPPGPQTQMSLLDAATTPASWSTQSQINPLPFFTPTTLSDANSPMVDVVSSTPPNSTNNLSPNGQEDTIFRTTINGFQGKVIESITLTLSNGVVYSVGGNSSGNQLGVVIGDSLINRTAPNATFSYVIMGSSLTLELLVDTGSNPSASITAKTFVINFTDGSSASNTGTALNLINLPQFVPPNSVPVTSGNEPILGTATVTEVEDSSLTLIDSGLAINTTNPAMGYVVASADFNKDGKSDVAVGNRGYTNSSGGIINNGTVQILMGGQSVLSGPGGPLSPPTSTDTSAGVSGNTGGFAIVGIQDGGQANGDWPLSMATGNVHGPVQLPDGSMVTYTDLIIGSPNNSVVYVIYGSYLASASAETVIDINSLTSAQGIAIASPNNNTDGTSSGDLFGFAVTVGNFDGSGGADIAIGAPNAANPAGQVVGGVYVLYSGSSSPSLVYQSDYSANTDNEQAGYSLATSAYVSGGSSTFSGSTSSDDLIIGAPNYSLSVTNTWTGSGDFPSNSPNPFPDSTSVNVGAVYVLTSGASGLLETPSFTYYGTDASTPSANGAAQLLFAGSALASGDWNGDKNLDLAIAAPSANENNGAVYILNGSSANASSNPQYLNQVSNLTLNGGLALGQAGTVVAWAGDVNDDGYEDLLVTAPQGANAIGQGYVVFGDSALLGVTAGDSFLTLSPIASGSKSTFLLNGNFPYQLTGQAAAAIGDINGDNVDDLMITAPNANQLYAVYGHPWLADDGSVKLADVSGDNGFVTDGSLYTLLGTEPVGSTEAVNIGGIQSRLAPALVVNNGTSYLAYINATNNQVTLVTSDDAGNNWSSPIELPGDITTSQSPALAFYQDDLYLAYVGSDNQINLAFSEDNGQSWSSPSLIGQTSSAGVSLVGYQDQLIAFFIADDPSSRILYAYSSEPQTDSWSTDYEVTYQNGSVISNQTASSAVSATVMGATLYLAYRGGTVGSADDYYVTNTSDSDLANLSWSISELTGATNPNSAPGITNDGNQLYFTFANASDQIVTSVSSNGDDWSAFNVIPDIFSNDQPSTVALDGNLYQGMLGNAATADIYFTSTSFNQPLVGTGRKVVMLGDVNGDGFADTIASGSPYGAILTFGASTQDLLDAATGTDDLIINIAAGGLIQTVLAAGDFNGDGLADFGVLDQNNNFYLNLGNANLGPQQLLTLSTSPTFSVSDTTTAVAVGDYNGDGYDDLLLTVNNQQQLYKGNRSGTLTNNEVFTANGNTVFNRIGDINGDGYDDIAGGAPSGSSGNGGGTVYLGNAAASSASGSTLTPPASAVSADLNNSSWQNFTYDSQQTKFNSAPSFAVFNGYLYMAYTGVSNSSDNGSLYVQRSADGYNWEGLTNFGSDFEAGTGFSLAVYQGALAAAYIDQYGELIYTYADYADNDLGLTFNQSNNFNTGTYASYVTPVLVSDPWNLYMYYATGNENQSEIDFWYYNETNGSWKQGSTLPNPPNAFLPLGGSFAVTTVGSTSYISFATGDGSSSAPGLTFGSSDGTPWSYTSIIESADSNVLRGTGLLSVGDTLYNYYLPSSGDINVITSTDQGSTWTSPSQVQAVSNQYWLTYPNPVYFNESVFLGYGVQLASGFNVDVSYAISNPIYQPNLTQQFGQQLEDIGDFNGDGIADFAVLAPGFFANTGIWNNQVLENNQGAVLIYYGSTSGLDSNSIPDVVLATPAPTSSTIVANNQAYLLSQMAPAGDVNGDGYDDLIIASPTTALTSANTTDGVAFVIFGGGNDLWGDTYPATKPFDLGNLTSNVSQLTLYFTTPLNTGNLPPANSFTVINDSPITVQSVSSIPNNPNELILTLASEANVSDSLTVIYTVPTSGTVLTYATGTNVAGFTASNDALVATLGAPSIEIETYTEYGFSITGLPNSQSGISLDGGGDINGDGFSDFLIGAPGNDDNLAYTLFGSDFNQTVTQTGTVGDDVMVGSPTGESFVAGQGDDLIVTGGGVDVAYAGPGNDQIIVNDLYFRRLDGGSGSDTLFFYGYNGQDWDLTTLSPGIRLQNFETLVTENYGANTITLNSVSVLQISPTNTITIFMDSTDSLVLSSDFSYSEVVYQYNQNFSEYVSSDTAARVLVNQPNSRNQVSFGASPTNNPSAILPTETIATEAVMALDSINAGAENFLGATSSVNEDPVTATNSANGLPTQIYVSNPTISEGSGRAEFTITRTGDLSTYTWFDYYTQDGDAKAGDRYTPVAGEAVFAPGEATVNVTVPIPNNVRNVGNRQFGLAVTLEGESADSADVPDAWNTAVASPKEQIRRWTLIPGDDSSSITFDVTTSHSTDRAVTLDMKLDGKVIPLVWNPSTLSYNNIPISNTNGIAESQDINGDLTNDLYRLRFQDGGPFDGDNLVNGLVALNFELAQLTPIPVPAAGGIISGTDGNDYIDAQQSTGTNRLAGLGGMDVIIGSPQRDVLTGGADNDRLYGKAGVDQLYGEDGDDLLDGGLAMDFLYGGPGADSFVLRAGNGPDRVMDFNAAEGDLFLLENLVFGALSFQSNRAFLGSELLATVMDNLGNPVTTLSSNPQWFVAI